MIRTLLVIVAMFVVQAGNADPPGAEAPPFEPLTPGFMVDLSVETSAHPNPEALLDEIIAASEFSLPSSGTYVYPRVAPRIPLFGYVREPARHIAPASFTRLREFRSSIVDLVRLRLEREIPEETDRAVRAMRWLENAVASLPRADSDDVDVILADSGTMDQDSQMDHYLMVVLDLNATEALPGLLKLEAALDSVALYRTSFLSESRATDDGAVATAVYRAARPHTRVLSVITALLRIERYPPLRKSELYIRYTEDFLALVSQHAGNANGFTLSAEPVETPPEDQMLVDELVRFRDRDSNRLDGRLSLPYSQETRDEIVALAVQFLKDVKPFEFVAERGMAATPRRR